MKIKFKVLDVMIKKLQNLKSETNQRFYQDISNYYDEKNYRRQSEYFQFPEDLFSNGAPGITEIMHEA